MKGETRLFVCNISKRRHIGVKLFPIGIYFQLRRVMTWHHLKIGGWIQGTLRVDARRKHGGKSYKTPGQMEWLRYVHALRIQISYWSTSSGRSGKPWVGGAMFYGGAGRRDRNS
jgi:hypothetical protein